jgi:hypothetical protein
LHVCRWLDGHRSSSLKVDGKKGGRERERLVTKLSGKLMQKSGKDYLHVATPHTVTYQGLRWEKFKSNE